MILFCWHPRKPSQGSEIFSVILTTIRPWNECSSDIKGDYPTHCVCQIPRMECRIESIIYLHFRPTLQHLSWDVQPNLGLRTFASFEIVVHFQNTVNKNLRNLKKIQHFPWLMTYFSIKFSKLKPNKPNDQKEISYKEISFCYDSIAAQSDHLKSWN